MGIEFETFEEWGVWERSIKWDTIINSNYNDSSHVEDFSVLGTVLSVYMHELICSALPGG